MAIPETAFSEENDRITWFFEQPAVRPESHSRAGAVSVLYLLRRELIETLGYDPDTDTEGMVDSGGSQRSLFASTILMFTMVDLLAKYMFGDTGGIGDRFKKFVWSPDGCGLTRVDAELLWAVRNSLVHSFGLPDSAGLNKTGHEAVGLGQREETTSGGFNGLVVVAHRGDDSIVFVDGLFRTVTSAISKYQETLYGTGSSDARARFAQAFSTYGWIRLSIEA